MSENLINWTDYLQVASLSDVGMRRSNNQDNFSVSLANSIDHYQKKGHLFIVADGMGAHAAGELASKLAIDHVAHLYNKYEGESAMEELRRAVSDANAEIHRRGRANEDFLNMGTTCSVLTLLPQGAIIAQIGDSRVYRLTQNRLEQLTFDHSLVWEMKAAGQLSSEDERFGKIPKNVITRSLGPYPEIKVDIEGPFPILVGDVFLLCSDGLTGVITDEEMAAILANMTPDEAVRVLVDLANLRGGPDNITVIVVKINHPQLATNHAAGPNRVKGTGEPSISPFAWGLIGAGILFALIFAAFLDWRTALLPAGVAVLSLLYALYRLVSNPSPRGNPSDHLRSGRGPYTRTNRPAGNQFSTQLAEIVRQLQSGAEEQNWRVDWEHWRGFISTAEQCYQKKDFTGAIQAYGRAISFLMDQLRNNQGSDSTIDL
jgi:PPM family protein phosphatase